MYLIILWEKNNEVNKDDGWNEMPSEVFVMRCGEWWVSLLDLRGSRHPYPLLPTLTWLTFSLLQVNDFNCKFLLCWCFCFLLLCGLHRWLWLIWSLSLSSWLPFYQNPLSTFSLSGIKPRSALVSPGNLPVFAFASCHHLNLFKILKVYCSHKKSCHAIDFLFTQ